MFLSPSKILDKLDIRPGMKVADFGCGSGHFTIEIAKRAGADGKVYAFDVQAEALELLKSRADLENLTNIETRRVNLETENGTQLVDGLIDFILISNILFQIEDKNILVKEVLRILRPGGKAVVIDWSSSGDNLGPPEEQIVGKDEIHNLFLQAGFIFDQEFDAGEYHYGLIFKKQE